MRKAIVYLGLVAAALPSSGLAAAPVCRSELAGVNERCPAWTGSYNHLEGREGAGEDFGRAIAISPSGDRVYVTGQSYDDATAQDQAVAAFDATSGVRLWSARVETPNFDTGSAVVATESAVFVTGRSGPVADLDWMTSAFDASSGQLLWTRRYAGPKGRDDTSFAIGAAPNGSTVFVTGGVDDGIGVPGDILTVAYDAANGDVLWSERFDGGAYDGSHLLEVAPDGQTVYVSGQSRLGTSDMITLAYRARGQEAGKLLWSTRLDNGSRIESPEGLAVSADGRRIAVAATSRTMASDGDYVTAVYDAVTGSQLWKNTYDGSRAADDTAGGVAIAGDVAVVTGKSSEQPAGSDYGTIAYELETGAIRWSRLLNSPTSFPESGLDIAASPDGTDVYVTGAVVVPRMEIQPIFKIEPGTIMTASYDVSDGTRSWVAHHNESGVGSDVGVDVEVAPTGQRVYVAGTFAFSGAFVYPSAEAKTYAYDFGLVAYDP